LIDCASVLRAIIRISLDGKYETLADRFEGKKFNSPNDVVLGPDGALYFTDPTLDLVKGEKQELTFQGVFRLDSKGKVTLLTRELSQPNGLAFSPDGKKFYVDDSEQRNIRVYDFHTDGTISNGRVFGAEPGGKDDGVPDGIKLDSKGNLYVTGPGGIWIWDSQGRHLGTIVMPEQPANLAWGSFPGRGCADMSAVPAARRPSPSRPRPASASSRTSRGRSPPRRSDWGAGDSRCRSCLRRPPRPRRWQDARATQPPIPLRANAEACQTYPSRHSQATVAPVNVNGAEVAGDDRFWGFSPIVAEGAPA
jgi:hypothetical protein